MRDLISKDFWLKLFSLALAVVIWTTVKIAISHEGTLAVDATTPVSTNTFSRLPITVLKSMSDLRVFKVVPSEVVVEVSGTEADLQSLRSASIQVFVNLTDARDTPGLDKKVQVLLPKGFKTERIRPTTVRIERVPPTD
jgi:YbbR domain-containing protein